MKRKTNFWGINKRERVDLPCCQNDTSSFFQFSHIISPFFFSPSSRLFRLFSIDEQRLSGNKSDAKTPTRGGSLSTGGGGGFCVVRS